MAVIIDEVIPAFKDLVNAKKKALDKCDDLYGKVQAELKKEGPALDLARKIE